MTKRRRLSHEEIYKKYPNILPGSIEEVPRGKVIICGKNEQLISHGTICIIKCIEADFSPHCLKTRVINIQDAYQSTRCIACARRRRNKERRR